MKIMKNIRMIIIFGISIILLGGCTNSTKEQNPLIGLCDEIDIAINDYQNQKLNKTEFITKIRSYKDECSGNEYLCTSINNFDMVEDTYSDEVFNAYITNLEVGCQKVKEEAEE